jgi:hypothetical protein
MTHLRFKYKSIGTIYSPLKEIATIFPFTQSVTKYMIERIKNCFDPKN